MFGLVPFAGRNNTVGSVNAPHGLFDIFDDAFFRSGSQPVRDRMDMQGGFRVDVKENGEGYQLAADLPGVAKEDIRLEYQNGYLTIAAERNLDKEEKEQDGYLRRERYHGSFSRSFYIDGIDEKGITAAFTDGVLKVEMPKLKEEAPAGHQISIA